MGYKEKYEYWLNSPAIDEKDREELKSIAGNEKEMEVVTGGVSIPGLF